ncbi:MAG: winged helix-turn-helix domain-containing protein [Sulfobacillus sp.]|nr:winged helix-turn-helix domain-containing protein [Sulfobacillus sp.]
MASRVRVGIFAPEGFRPWISGQLAGCEVLTLHTVNQVLEGLSQHTVDYLVIDPAVLEDPRWLSVVIYTAVSEEVPTMMVTDYLTPLAVWVTPAQLDHMIPFSAGNPCTELSLAEQRVWHHGQEIRLPTRVFQLLAVLVMAGKPLMTAEAINKAASGWGWQPWSDSHLRTGIHHLRQVLGEGHIQTVRSVGYQFIPCADGWDRLDGAS